ncbi:DUF2399 domain-containing protein [Streptomyces kronopolitis]|uniref:DUF2399 domain-containing protein n=1 Tax=Streptomyces kronopolitis TaxID=1612435 RepID=UPI003413B752
MRYHGDFDWGGLRIAAALLRRVPWSPWRYTAAHYRAAVRALAARRSPGRGRRPVGSGSGGRVGGRRRAGGGGSSLDDLLSDLG